MKLLLDEQISRRVAERLRDRGHDATAVTADPSLKGAMDPVVFEKAQEEGRALVTYNRDDFLAIAADYGQRGEEHAGLVIINPRQIPNQDFARLVDELDSFLGTYEPHPSFTCWLP